MLRICLIGLLSLIATLAQATQTDSYLPRPAGIERDIAFWTRVYTEVETTGGLIHDSRRLDIVYEVVDFGEGTSRRVRNRQVEKLKKHYRQILLTLANGKREGLTAEEQRVLSLWGEDTSKSELATAANLIRFQLGQANRFRAGLVRSGIWLPYIRQTLAERGLPPELAALPHVESSFNPDAWSKVGAAGMWQFTRSTGRRFMRIDHVVDERMDPYMATDAAARLLEYNYQTLGSWPLAITAYNHGVAGMRRAIRQQGTDDVETILRRYKGRTFGFASRNFYPAFLAAVQIDADPEKYFGPITRRGPADTTTVTLEDYVSVQAAAAGFGIDTDTLRQYNPALMPAVWTGNKHIPRGFPLRLPTADLGVDPYTLIAAIDPAGRYSAQKPDVLHKVRRGDTLSQIASQYGVSLNQLVAINNLRSKNHIRAGQVLRLPLPGDNGQDVLVAAAPPPAAPAPEAEEPAAVVAMVTPDEPADAEPSPAGEGAAIETPRADEPAAGLVADAEPAGATLPVAPESSVAASETVDADTVATAQVVLAADPSDYTVADDGYIVVQSLETLGHYADWLQIRTQRLRDINRLKFGKPVFIGQRLKLDLSKIDRETFEQWRLAYHRDLQEAFFARHQIRETETYTIRSGDSVWMLAQRRYQVPVWLLRQYNPDLELDRLRPGTAVQFPLLAPAMAEGSSGI